MPIPVRKEQTRASVPSRRESKSLFVLILEMTKSMIVIIKSNSGVLFCSISNALLQLLAILHYLMSIALVGSQIAWNTSNCPLSYRTKTSRDTSHWDFEEAALQLKTL